MPHLCSGLLLSLLIALSASAVTMDWVTVGNLGNAGEPQTCFGCGPGHPDGPYVAVGILNHDLAPAVPLGRSGLPPPHSWSAPAGTVRTEV